MSTSQPSSLLRRERILSSKLYFAISSNKVPLIYSKSYDISFMGIEKMAKYSSGSSTSSCLYVDLTLRHPFDSSKWGRICQFLLAEEVLQKEHIVEPIEASQADLLVVHTEAYLNSLKNSLNVAKIIEVPPVSLFPNFLLQWKVLYPFRKQVGGSVLAGKLAKERGWAINVGGGFHHCSSINGGGFCAYADISLCVHYAFERLNITKVMIIDLDAHQGNGHEMDFSKDERVYILDVYNKQIYPQDFEARKHIHQKVELVTGTLTEDYLELLKNALQIAEKRFEPELVIYNAGTDILDGDPLGGLRVSPEGVIERDEMVFAFAKKRSIPIVMLTSGGYMRSSARVVADSIKNLKAKNMIRWTLSERM